MGVLQFLQGVTAGSDAVFLFVGMAVGGDVEGKCVGATVGRIVGSKVLGIGVVGSGVLSGLRVGGASVIIGDVGGVAEGFGARVMAFVVFVDGVGEVPLYL